MLSNYCTTTPSLTLIFYFNALVFLQLVVTARFPSSAIENSTSVGLQGTLRTALLFEKLIKLFGETKNLSQIQRRRRRLLCTSQVPTYSWERRRRILYLRLRSHTCRRTYRGSKKLKKFLLIRRQFTARGRQKNPVWSNSQIDVSLHALESFFETFAPQNRPTTLRKIAIVFSRR